MDTRKEVGHFVEQEGPLGSGKVRTGGNRTCDWEQGVFGTGSGGCPVMRGAPNL